MNTITIYDKEDVEAVIYVFTQLHNPFLSAWGLIIDRQGERVELHDKAGDDDAQRLLLEATVRGLEALPVELPVKIVSHSEYLTRWVLGRLEALRQDDYQAARRKKLPNLDLVERLYQLTKRRPYVDLVWARSDPWPDPLIKAAALARGYGSKAAAPARTIYKRRKLVSPKPKSPTVVLPKRAVVSGVTYDDVPWN